MSRIGKKVIVIPSKTEVTLQDGVVTVKGPLGQLSRPLPTNLSLTVADNTITIAPQGNNPEISALWGTFASHITNMVAGVGTAFSKKLFLEGIGYKVDVKGNDIVMALGFSHPVTVAIPEGLKVIIEKNGITISGIDKEKVGSFTARIRDLKKPEPYKGKGLRYDGEVIKIKQGKKSV
jgi:large subunit ribosomal protein L6